MREPTARTAYRKDLLLVTLDAVTAGWQQLSAGIVSDVPHADNWILLQMKPLTEGQTINPDLAEKLFFAGGILSLLVTYLLRIICCAEVQNCQTWLVADIQLNVMCVGLVLCALNFRTWKLFVSLSIGGSSQAAAEKEGHQNTLLSIR